LQEVSLQEVLFHIDIWSPSTIYAHVNLLYSHFPLPVVPPQTHTEPILQSCLSLLIFKLTFKEFSQCIPTVSIYFDLFSPFHYSPLPLYLPLPIFNSFQHIFLYPPPSQMLCFMMLLILYHSFFLFLLPRVS
jgi:hypothetical protein